MYDLLYDLSRRPEPFSRYTAKELWTLASLFHFHRCTLQRQRQLILNLGNL